MLESESPRPVLAQAGSAKESCPEWQRTIIRVLAWRGHNKLQVFLIHRGTSPTLTDLPHVPIRASRLPHLPLKQIHGELGLTIQMGWTLFTVWTNVQKSESWFCQPEGQVCNRTDKLWVPRVQIFKHFEGDELYRWSKQNSVLSLKFLAGRFSRLGQWTVWQTSWFSFYPISFLFKDIYSLSTHPWNPQRGVFTLSYSALISVASDLPSETPTILQFSPNI